MAEKKSSVSSSSISAGLAVHRPASPALSD